MGWLLLLFAARERAGRFRTSVCASCTYLQGFSALQLSALPVCRAVSDVFSASVCDSCTYLRGFSALELSALPVCRAVSDFVSVLVASDLVIPHLPVGFLGHERVCRAVSELCVRFLHLSAGLSVAAL